MWAFGKAAAVGFEVESGAAGRWPVSVVVTGTEWESASGAAGSAGGAVTADRPSAAGGETGAGVNFAASPALGLCVFVVVALVPGSAGQTAPLHLGSGAGLPQASWPELGVSGGLVVPLETNPMEPSVWKAVKRRLGVILLFSSAH